MSKLPCILSVLTLSLMPAASIAATLMPYTPGGSPCAGVCTQPWAEAAFAVPTGEATPLTIPAGTPIRMMSYAKAGKAYAVPSSSYFSEDQPGIGYPIGDGLWMVRIDACANWAVVTMGSPGGAIDSPVLAMGSPVGTVGLMGGTVGLGPSFAPGTSRPVSGAAVLPAVVPGGPLVISRPDPVFGNTPVDLPGLPASGGGVSPDASPVDLPVPVPLPASVLMLAAALLAMIAVRFIPTAEHAKAVQRTLPWRFRG